MTKYLISFLGKDRVLMEGLNCRPVFSVAASSAL
jgi:hypothetical protein